MNYNKKITILLSYYNQSKNTLIRHIEHWKSFESKHEFSFSIIDDASRIHVTELLEDVDYTDLDLHVYRVQEDLYCNIAGVRNLGAQQCNTPYMVILDMDTIINNTMSKKLLELVEKNKEDKKVYKFNRRVPENEKHKKHNRPHPAICLIRKQDYWNIGGCEEDLVGHYGSTDPAFWHRAQGKVKVNVCKDIYLLYYPDAESDINRDMHHNITLIESKKAKNNWSNDFVRFKWVKVI